MASHSHTTLPLLLLLLVISLTSATKPSSTPSSYIKSSCSITRYPSLCVDSLSTYSTTIKRNPKQIAQAALSVSLEQARSAKEYVVKMSKTNKLRGMEYQVVKDCIETMGDSVDRLSTSLGELGHMRGGEGREESFMWHMSNVQTWVSAALTDENTCMDGFAGHGLDGKVKSGIRARVNGVARVTSNALALVNRFADRH